VGADAVSSEGDLYNKVGTSMIALAAREHGKKFFSCTGTHKFDPLSLWGEKEVVEARDASEVVSARDLGLKRMPASLGVLNPAFDLTEARFVNAYVTEVGLIPPQAIVPVLWKEFDLSREASL
ncbi:MAG: ribose 1,5-bisphosphate isomerase, partial [Candidatus Norongarragalinales archaeon]